MGGGGCRECGVREWEEEGKRTGVRCWLSEPILGSKDAFKTYVIFARGPGEHRGGLQAICFQCGQILEGKLVKLRDEIEASHLDNEV